jgi:hypothetical protein
MFPFSSYLEELDAIHHNYMREHISTVPYQGMWHAMQGMPATTAASSASIIQGFLGSCFLFTKAAG